MSPLETLGDANQLSYKALGNITWYFKRKFYKLCQACLLYRVKHGKSNALIVVGEF